MDDYIARYGLEFNPFLSKRQIMRSGVRGSQVLICV